MAAFLAMDGYGVYIWVSYTLAFAFVLGASLHSWRAARRNTQKQD